MIKIHFVFVGTAECQSSTPCNIDQLSDSVSTVQTISDDEEVVELTLSCGTGFELSGGPSKLTCYINGVGTWNEGDLQNYSCGISKKL